MIWNKEYEYTISLSSYYPHTEETIYKILECRTLNELVLPASSPILNWKKLTKVFSVSEIKSVNLINEQSPDQDYFLYLYGDSGVDLNIRVIVETIMGSSSIVIKFSNEENALRKLNVELIESLFSELVPVFKPYYGSAYGKSIGLRYLPSGQPKYYKDELSKRSYPLDIRWITYFGIDMLDFLGLERFKRLRTYFKKYDLFQGILIVLQEEFPLLDVPRHQERRDQAENELGFLELLLEG